MTRIHKLSYIVIACAVALSAGAALAGEHGKTGTEAVHVGEPFADAKKVEIAALLADPDPYVGETVRLEGSVASYCHHQRGWFALADAEGTVVRLVTAPAFTVPGEIEKVAGIGVGVVEVVEVPEDQAKHYAGDHGLGTPDEISGPQKQIIIRATGAEFAMSPAAAAKAGTVPTEPCEDHGDEEAADHDHG
jgi:hypothetical protein